MMFTLPADTPVTTPFETVATERSAVLHTADDVTSIDEVLTPFTTVYSVAFRLTVSFQLTVAEAGVTSTSKVVTSLTEMDAVSLHPW